MSLINNLIIRSMLLLVLAVPSGLFGREGTIQFLMKNYLILSFLWKSLLLQIFFRMIISPIGRIKAGATHPRANLKKSVDFGIPQQGDNQNQYRRQL